MKLELKHLAGYSPYGLKAFRENKSIPSDAFIIRGATKENVFLSENGLTLVDINRIKPILHPLSDLTKQIEVNGKKFIPLTELLKQSNFDVEEMSFSAQLEYIEPYSNILFMSHLDAQKLLEWHFDIYGLIPEGLAIDINTLNK